MIDIYGYSLIGVLIVLLSIGFIMIIVKNRSTRLSFLFHSRVKRISWKNFLKLWGVVQLVFIITSDKLIVSILAASVLMAMVLFQYLFVYRFTEEDENLFKSEEFKEFDKAHKRDSIIKKILNK